MPGELQQHDLKPRVAAAIVAEAGVGPDDTVVEVGPGLGELTTHTLAAGATVLAIETDPQRVAGLRSRFAGPIASGKLGLSVGDVRRLVLQPPPGWRVLANPPFHLTSWLFHHWLLDDLPGGPPRRIDLVLQLQAAHKLGGHPGAETRSSVIARLFGRPRLAMPLKRDDVVPPSRVDLCVWSLERDRNAPPADELARIDRLLERGFAGPQTVREALKGIATGEQLRRQAREQRWDPDAHPRTLAPAAWRSLADILHRTGKLR